MIRIVGAIVLFVEDLEKCVSFYRDTIGLKPVFNDDVSYDFKFGEQDFLLLQRSAAIDMLGEVGGQWSGSKVMLCAAAEDVDASYEALKAKGVKFINPPKDQAWGRRTAHFADPEGNLWELYKELGQ
jgi:lactoylglutathione lyase